MYGARELATGRYADRTRANARDSDAPPWFGSTDASGARAALGACRQLGCHCVCAVEGQARTSEVAAWIAEGGSRC
jgi:hypothetical protein